MRRFAKFLAVMVVLVLFAGCCALFQTPEAAPKATETEQTDSPGGDNLTPSAPPPGNIPTQDPQITPTDPEPTEDTPSNMPIVYAKDASIWIYYPESQEKFALTGSGSLSGLEGYFFYPKLSPSGVFVAFKQRYGEYIVLNLQDYSYERIPNGNTQLWSTENILGWDANDLLYVTRQTGACVFWQEPNSKITAVDILVYDPRARAIVDSFPLPQDAGNTGNSTGVGVSPSGRYITADPFWCGPEDDLVPYFVYDRQSGALYAREAGHTLIADNELWLAELDDSKLFEGGASEIRVRGIGEENARLTYRAANNGAILYSMNWSPNSEFIAALEYPSSENWSGRWTPDRKGGNKLILLPAGGISAALPGQAEALVLDANVLHIFGWSPDSRAIIYTTGDIDANGYYQNITLQMLNLDTLEKTTIDTGQIFNAMY
ncbi:MAG: hypothetical protein GYA81_00855 [Chloroflexi bacterium]|nr:hypothetical protein [Chloroflexota bacterium]